MSKGDIKILIVDDSNTNIVLLEAVFSGKGYRVETTLNAIDAFQSISKEKPDLILLDLLMPKISGYDFMKRLNQDELTSDIPVIVISAVTDYDNIKKIMEMGISDYVKKPVDIEDLVVRVNKILNFSNVDS